MINTYNPREPVKEIVSILHKYKIPISAVNQVFELVQEDIQRETVPYNPKNENATKINKIKEWKNVLFRYYICIRINAYGCIF